MYPLRAPFNPVNSTNPDDFVVSENGKSGPSIFMFATEDGTISGWNPGVDRTHAIIAVDRSTVGLGAVYKGLAIASRGNNELIYATNFRFGTVEAFDRKFKLVRSFTDRELSNDCPLPGQCFAPFGIQNINGDLWVTYALQNAAKHDDVGDPGMGRTHPLVTRGVRGYICVPLWFKDHFEGTLAALFTYPLSSNGAEMQVLGGCATHIAAALAHARLLTEIEHKQARLRAVLDQLPEGVVIIEASDGCISYANAAAERIVGTAGRSLLGYSLSKHAHSRLVTYLDGRPIPNEDLSPVRALLCHRAARRIRDMRHKATRAVIDFCVEHEVGSLFIGNPHGVRNRDSGRHHNQRMALWEYGKDIDYLTHKAKQSQILSFTGSERGTSSQCPRCGHKHKPKGRVWRCKQCGFIGHRDLVGSVNMHQLAYGSQVEFPRSFTYLRPGSSRSSSRADTPQCCLSESTGQPLRASQVPLGTGYTVGVAQKPISL